jgi:hypothetical protein
MAIVKSNVNVRTGRKMTKSYNPRATKWPYKAKVSHKKRTGAAEERKAKKIFVVIAE